MVRLERYPAYSPIGQLGNPRYRVLLQQTPEFFNISVSPTPAHLTAPIQRLLLRWRSRGRGPLRAPRVLDEAPTQPLPQRPQTRILLSRTHSRLCHHGSLAIRLRRQRSRRCKSIAVPSVQCVFVSCHLSGSDFIRVGFLGSGALLLFRIAFPRLVSLRMRTPIGFLTGIVFRRFLAHC